MRPPPSLLPALLLALLAASGPALARDATGGAAPVSMIQHADAEDVKDPNISQPKEAGVDCMLEITQAEAANVRDNARIAELRKKCLPQTDAFKSAAEAASYLAFYQQAYSDYGVKMADPKYKAEVMAAVQECISGGPNCDDSTKGNKMRNKLIGALIQYNFGKDIRAQMLENQTRARNMATLDLSPQELKELGWQGKRVLSRNGVLPVNRVKENTFRLDPKDVHVFEADKLSAEERTRLGVEFNNTFNQFVNEYTSSTGQRGPKSRWAYVAVRSAAVGGNGFVYVTKPDQRNPDPREGKAAIDGGRLSWDVKTQGAKDVDEVISTFRNDFKDVNARRLADKTMQDPDHPDDPTKLVNKQVDSMQRAYELAGFGLPESQLAMVGRSGPDAPKDADQVARQIVLNMNKAITLTEKQKQKEAMESAQNVRVPSSAGPGAKPLPPAPSVTLDVGAFDKFLDDIWPPAEKRQEGTY